MLKIFNFWLISDANLKKLKFFSFFLSGLKNFKKIIKNDKKNVVFKIAIASNIFYSNQAEIMGHLKPGDGHNVNKQLIVYSMPT